MNIKDARIAAGMTQRQLAEAARVNIRQLQKIEAGEIRLGNITLSTAARLAAALDIDLDSLAAEIPAEK